METFWANGQVFYRKDGRGGGLRTGVLQEKWQRWGTEKLGDLLPAMHIERV